eukprot:655531-Pelagomonas_calceolata.AAC.17
MHAALTGNCPAARLAGGEYSLPRCLAGAACSRCAAASLLTCLPAAAPSPPSPPPAPSQSARAPQAPVCMQVSSHSVGTQ